MKRGTCVQSDLFSATRLLKITSTDGNKTTLGYVSGGISSAEATFEEVSSMRCTLREVIPEVALSLRV
jgi:hypothetical protein